MKPNNKKYILLLLLIILNIAIRLPMTSHERGNDSFYVHSLANTIVANGNVEWMLHPLSAIGLFPFSYPSGIPVFLAELSYIIGTDIEYTILIVSLFLGVLSVFSMYLLAKEIKDDTYFIFFAIFAFSIAPIFIDYTSWTITARGAFIALSPLAIWSLLKYHNTQYKSTYLFLNIIIFTTLMTIHRAAFLLFLFVVAYYLSSRIEYIYEMLKINDKQKALIKKNIPFIYGLCFFILIILPFCNIPLYSEHLYYSRKASSSFLFQQVSNPILLIINMLIFYTLKCGVLIIFMPIGLITIIQKTNLFYVRLISISFLLFISVIGLRSYTLIAVLALLSILASFGILRVLSLLNKRKILTSFTIVLCLLIPIISSCFMMNYWNSPSQVSDSPRYLYNSTYNSGKYIKEYVNDYPFEGPGESRIRAIFDLKLLSAITKNSIAIDKNNIRTSFSLSYFDRGHLSPYKISYIEPPKRILKSEIKYHIRYRTTNFSTLIQINEEKIYNNGFDTIMYSGKIGA